MIALPFVKHHTDLETSRAAFRTIKVPGLFVRYDNLRETAGHIRLFSSRAPAGWMVYAYNQLSFGWALHRVWNFVLFAVHHVGPGDSMYPNGWHVQWAKLGIKKELRGITITWRPADTYRPMTPTYR